MADEVGDQRLNPPGRLDQPSMAAWPRPSRCHPSEARWAALGFRLAKDA